MTLATVLALGCHAALASGAPELDIGQALHVALGNAPALTSAESQVAGADAQKLTAVASFLPSLSINNQLQRYHPFTNTGSRLVGGLVVPTEGQSTDDNVTTAQFSVNLFNGGKDAENYRAAVQTLISANLALTAAMDKLFQQLLDDFVAASSDQLKVASQERLLRLDQGLLALTQERLRGQFADRIDLLKSQQQVLSDQTALTQTREQQVTDLAALYADMGMIPSTEFTPLVPWLPAAPEIASLDAVAHDDPEVQSALAAMLAAQRKVGAARAGNYPTVALTGEYDLYGQSSGSLTSAVRATRHTDYSVGLSVTVPLSSYPSVRADVDQSIADMKGAQGRYDAALVDAANRIADAPRKLDDARQALDLAKRSAELAHRNVALTRDRYSAKEADRIDVENARSLAQQADLTLATARLRYCVAGWELLRAARPREFPSDLLAAVLEGLRHNGVTPLAGLPEAQSP